jgi:PAS domain S-box-containing protein
MRNLNILWQAWVEPSGEIQGLQRRQAQLVASFILIFILVDALWYFLTTIVLHGDNTQPTSNPILAVINIGVLLAAYKLSRTKHYQQAALLTLCITTLIIFITGTTNPTSLNYLVIPILVSAIFLKFRISLLFTIIILGSILIYGAIFSIDSFISSAVHGAFAFTAITSTFLIVAVRASKTLAAMQQAQLIESKANFRSLFDHSPQPMWIYDVAANKFLDVNAAAITHYGYSRLEFLHLSIAELQPIANARGLLIESHQGQHRLKDGRLIDVEVVIHPIEFSGRSAVLVLAQDITERKRAEAALQRERSLLRALVDTLPENVYVKDVESRFLMANVGTAHIMGVMQPANLLGKTDFEFFPEELAAQYYADERHLIQSGQPILDKQEPLQVMSTGEHRWISTNKVPLRDSAGQIIGLVGIGHDVTERKQMEEELRAHRAHLEQLVEERTVDLIKANQQLQVALDKEKELGELKTQFVSMVSHQFRTPLTIISIYCDVLQNYGHKLNDAQKEMRYVTIQSEVVHMTHLLEDVLTLGKAEAKQLQLKPTNVDLEPFLTMLVTDTETTIGIKHRLEFSYIGQHEEVYLDAEFVKHALTNLLSNAFKYSPAGSTIYFEARVDEQQVIFRVQDSGIGIPAEDLPHLFEAFHRGANAACIRGTGLGLNIVKQIVELHHGTIRVESTIGVGTTFVVTLPARNVTYETLNKSA